MDLRIPFGGIAVGGSNGSTAAVPVPTIWTGRRFEVDLAELQAHSRGPEDEALRRAAVAWSLDVSTDSKTGAVSGDMLQPAVQGLAGLILYGLADEARALLHATWPSLPVDGHPVTLSKVAGEDEFWRRLCAAAVRNPLWSALAMDRIPHADLVRVAAVPPSPR